MSNYDQIYAVVQQIPPGKVATYGQIAKLAGLPGHARQVGYALHALHSDNIPWHRVVNAAGEISLGNERGGANLQRTLLESEGITFADSGRLSLASYQWQQID
jgi:methylated-DNA-protein-cysteine methyltransferase-like protein